MMERKYTARQVLRNIRRAGSRSTPPAGTTPVGMELVRVPTETYSVMADVEIVDAEAVRVADTPEPLDPRADALARLEAAPPIELFDEAAWAKWCAVNTDAHARQAVVYAEHWARLMQAEIDAGHELADIACSTKELVDLIVSCELSHNLLGAVMYALTSYWAHGQTLDEWAVSTYDHSFRAGYIKRLLEGVPRMSFVDDAAERVYYDRRSEHLVIRAERWARIMEAMMKSGRSLTEVAPIALHDVERTDDSTLLLYETAYMVGFLSGTWMYGPELYMCGIDLFQPSAA